MKEDVAAAEKVVRGDSPGSRLLIKYCRACELACPKGRDV
jgi:hypothetical protein